MSSSEGSLELEQEIESGDDILSTGMQNLDAVLESRGLKEGSTVGLMSEPDGNGNTFLANMIAKRPAYYFTLSRPIDMIIDHIQNMENVNTDYTAVRKIANDNPIEDLREQMKEIEFPRGTSIIINPVNDIENVDRSEYRDLLTELREKARECRGLVILHGMKSDNTTNRWFTKHYVETLFDLRLDNAGEKVTEYLTISKLHPEQELVTEGERVFETEVQLDMDIATTRNITP